MYKHPPPRKSSKGYKNKLEKGERYKIPPLFRKYHPELTEEQLYEWVLRVRIEHINHMKKLWAERRRRIEESAERDLKK